MKWKWYKPRRHTPDYQSPCCDHITLPERGNHLICPICFWEDDGIDLDEVDAHSGPNHMTLRQGRHNFKEPGACDSKMIKNVIDEKERNNFKLIV